MARPINAYDYLRVMTAFAVVFLHTAAPYLYDFNTLSTPNWMAVNIYDSISRWCVPIFFMLSGAFLLNPKREETLKVLYTKRVMKLLIPLIAWSIIYYIYTALLQSNFSLEHFVRDFLNNETFFHLWFLYILIGLYVLIPILRMITRQASQKMLLYILLLWFIQTPLKELLNHYFHLDIYFDIPVGKYLGFFLLGYYLMTYEIPKKTRILSYILAVISLFVTIYGTYVGTFDHEGRFYGFYYYYLRPNVIFMAIAVFILFKYSHISIAPTITKKIDGQSFGIYLVHALLLKEFTRLLHLLTGHEYLFSNLYINTIVVAVFIFILSYFVSKWIRRIPVIKNIIP